MTTANERDHRNDLESPAGDPVERRGLPYQRGDLDENLCLLVCLGASDRERCPYLPGRSARLLFWQLLAPLAGELDRCFAGGYRRHGAFFYSPVCDRCRECVPLRIRPGEFRPSRSQRRVRRRYRDLYEVTRVEPACRPEHVELFNRHAAHVSPSARPLGPEEYAGFLLECPGRSEQFEYRIGGELAGVGVLDVDVRSASSIYFFWNPDFARYSPGTFSILWEIEWCRRHGLEHYYLGYWVDGCRSMAYKRSFHPHEVMDWRTGTWRRVDR